MMNYQITDRAAYMSEIKKKEEVDKERKALFVSRLLETVREYFDAFKEPISAKILSAKYAKAFQPFGGLPEVLKELSNSNQLQIYLLKSGGKCVYPPRVKAIGLPEDGVRL